MPLPEDFNDWEHIQSVYRQIHNREVREEFVDIEIDDDITTPRGSLKVACLIKDNDPAQLMDLRERLFERIRGKNVFSFGEDSKEFVPRRKKPQINLYFLEDLSDVEEGYRPVKGRISFRLMEEPDNGTFTESKAKSYANKIKSDFATGSGYVWKKGKELWSYADWVKGYQLQILSVSESEAKEVIGKVLSIQSDTPDWDLLHRNVAAQPSSTYPTIPPSVTVMGKTVKMPRRRPVANVRFQFATLSVLSLATAVLLVDRTGYLTNPLVS